MDEVVQWGEGIGLGATSSARRSTVSAGRASASSSRVAICSAASGHRARAGRPAAREQLRTAHEMLMAMGVEALALRAARELVATGETARPRTVETSNGLTAEETQIARLARDGLSNPAIGAPLFSSPGTVEYHLRKVFTKLDIRSRRELLDALVDGSRAAVSA